MNDLPSIESVRCFVEAARFLNFRAASRAVALTPAALGKRIQQLEELLGVKLFHRTTRRVTLTQAGLSFLPKAKELLDAAQECIRAGRGETGPPMMELTLGTRHELGLSFLAPLLPSLRRAMPHVTFHLYFGSGPDIELRVRTQEIDCGMTSRPIKDPRVDGIRMHLEEYAFVGHPDLLERNPLARFDQAARHTLIDAHAELPLFHYWRSAPKAKGKLDFKGVLKMGTISAIRLMILAGEGVGVLPRYLVKDDLETGRLVEVFPEIKPASDHFKMIFRADDPRRAIFSKLSEHLLTSELC